MDQQNNELEQVEFEQQQLRILKDNLNNLRMRFTQNYYLIMNKEEDLNNCQFDNDTLLHKENVLNELINDRNKDIILQLRNEKEMDSKIDKFQQAGALYITKEQLEEQKIEYIKAQTNLMNYPIFKNEVNMPDRKKEALRGLAGQQLIELALFEQQILDVNLKLNENQESPEGGGDGEGQAQIDAEQNIKWQARQQIKVYYGNNQSALFSTIRVVPVPGENTKPTVEKISFRELLMSCSRYWQVEPSKQVFIDLYTNMWSFRVNVWQEQDDFINNIRNIHKRDIYIKMISLTDLRILQKTGAMRADGDDDEPQVKKYRGKVNNNQQSDDSDKEDEDQETQKKVVKKIPFWRRFRNRMRIIKQSISLFFQQVFRTIRSRFSKFDNKLATLLKQLTYFLFIAFHLAVIYSHRSIMRNNHCIQFLEDQLFSVPSSFQENSVYTIRDITTVDQIFHFTIYHWLNTLYSDVTYNYQEAKKAAPSQFLTMDRYFLIGNPTIQLNRVTPVQCDDSTYPLGGLPDYNENGLTVSLPCYGDYSSTTANKNPLTQKQWTTRMCDAESTCQTNQLNNFYRYQTHGERQQHSTTYFGIQQDFPNDGIIGDLFDTEKLRKPDGDNISSFQTQYVLKKWLQFFPFNFYDSSTRGIILTANLMHMNYNIIFLTTAVIEQDPSGEIKVRTKIRGINLDKQNMSDLNRNVVPLIEAIMFWWFSIQIIREIIASETNFRYQKRKLEYNNKNNKDYVIVRANEPSLNSIKSGREVALAGWNLIYYVFFVTHICYTVFVVYTKANFNLLDETKGEDVFKSIDMSEVDYWIVLEEYLESINVSMMFISVFKVFQDSQLLRLFIQTIWNSFQKLLGYLIFCLIFVTIFAMVARMLMGANNESFKDYPAAVSRMMTVFISRFHTVDLTTNHYTEMNVLLIYAYNILYIVIGYMMLKKYLVVVFSNEYIKLLAEYKKKESGIDDLFLPFALIFSITSFLVLDPISTVLAIIRKPIEIAMLRHKDSQLIKMRIKLKLISEKENLERQKMRVLLEQGEEAMQMQFNVRMATEELEGTEKGKEKAKKEDPEDPKEKEEEEKGKPGKQK